MFEKGRKYEIVQDELLVSNTVQNFTEHKLLDSGRPDSSNGDLVESNVIIYSIKMLIKYI